jgi:hypothetical protein
VSVHFFIRLLVNNFNASQLASPPDTNVIQNWQVASNSASLKKSIVISYIHKNYSEIQYITLNRYHTNYNGITSLQIFASTGSNGVQELLHTSKLPALLHIFEVLDVIFGNHSTDLSELAEEETMDTGQIKIKDKEDFLIIGNSLISEFGLSTLQTTRAYAVWQLKQRTFIYATPRFFFDTETQSVVHNLSKDEQGETYQTIRDQYEAQRVVEKSREVLAEDLALPRLIVLS